MAVKLRGAGSIPAAAFSKAWAYRFLCICSLKRKIVAILNYSALAQNGIDKVSKSSQLEWWWWWWQWSNGLALGWQEYHYSFPQGTIRKCHLSLLVSFFPPTTLCPIGEKNGCCWDRTRTLLYEVQTITTNISGNGLGLVKRLIKSSWKYTFQQKPQLDGSLTISLEELPPTFMTS